jgi:hypothetical protein
MGRPTNTRLVATTKMLAQCQTTESGCWEWTGARLHFGHGRIRCDGKMWRTHRLAYDEWVGPIPDGLDVLHKCDNPPCFNPDHLFVGTRSDNRFDCLAKNRHAKGTSVHLAKLDEDAVSVIRNTKRQTNALAERFGVSRTTIQRVRSGKTWKHL